MKLEVGTLGSGHLPAIPAVAMGVDGIRIMEEPCVAVTVIFVRSDRHDGREKTSQLSLNR